jgi:O-antigen/teichoic acid export membrane protein
MRSRAARESFPLSGAVRGVPTVFSDLASLLAAQAGSALLSVVSILITTRILDPADYGLVAYVGITAIVIFAVAAAWTSTAVTRYAREQVDATGSMRNVTWSRLELAVVPLAIVCAAVVVVKALGVFPAGFSWGLTCLALMYGLLLIVTDQVLYALQAIGRMKLSALAVVLQQLLYILGLTLILVAGIDQTPFVVVSAFLLASLPVTLALGSRVWGAAIWPPEHDPELRRRMRGFSVPMTAFCASQYTIRWADLLVLGVLAGPVATGLYAIAYRGYTVLQELTRASTTVFTPLFVSLRNSDREDLVDRYLRRAIPQLTLVAATVLGMGVLFVEPVVPVVFGEAFDGAAEPLSLLLFAVLLAFSIQLYVPVIVLHERTKELGRLGVTAAIVNVVGDVVLVGVLDGGIIGPAIATCAALAIVLVGYAGVARECTGTTASLRVSTMLPFLTGFGVTLAVDGPSAVLIGLPAVILSAVMVVLVTRPFEHEDAKLLGKLDMPVTMKRLTLRTVAIASR